MSHLLHNLSKEGILLMYLAGELPAGGVAELEQTLARDASLREELEQLRAAYEGAGAAIRAADASVRPALPTSAASRRVGQAVRGWHARRLARPQADAEPRQFLFPTWSYPIAAAIILVVVFTGWWGIQTDGPVRVGQTQPTRVSDESDEFAKGPAAAAVVAEDPAVAELSPQEQSEIMGPWRGSLPSPAPDAYAADADLDAAEAELLALSETPALADDGTSLLLTGDTDER